MAGEDMVLRSACMEGGHRRVDVFVRFHATHGFEENRRDPEDPSGWLAIGGFGVRREAAVAEAPTAARASIPLARRGGGLNVPTRGEKAPLPVPATRPVEGPGSCEVAVWAAARAPPCYGSSQTSSKCISRVWCFS